MNRVSKITLGPFTTLYSPQAMVCVLFLTVRLWVPSVVLKGYRGTVFSQKSPFLEAEPSTGLSVFTSDSRVGQDWKGSR